MQRRRRVLGASCIFGSLVLLFFLAAGNDQPWFASLHATSTMLGQVPGRRPLRVLPNLWAGKAVPTLNDVEAITPKVSGLSPSPQEKNKKTALLNSGDTSDRMCEVLVERLSTGTHSLLKVPADSTSRPKSNHLDAIYSSIQSSLIFVKGKKCGALNNFQDVTAKDVFEADPEYLEKPGSTLEPGPNAKPLKIDYVLTYVSPRAMPETPFLKRSSERYRDWNELHWSLRSVFQNGQLCLNPGWPTSMQMDPADACLIGNIYLVVANKRHVPKWLQSILDNGLAPFENRHSLEQLNDNNASTLGYNPKCSTIPDREKAFQSFLAKKLKIIEHHQIFPMPNASAMSPLTKELLQAASARKQLDDAGVALPRPLPMGSPPTSPVSTDPITTIESYNSNAIDLVLHRIPGLRRHFISVNNDMLLGRKLEMKNVFAEVGDGPLVNGTRSEEYCAMIPVSYYTETMTTPREWCDPPNTNDTTIGQVEFMKRYTVSLTVTFAQKSVRMYFPKETASSLPSQASMIYEFAHVPMLYDRDFMKAISESEPFSPAVTRVLSTQLHGRGLLDIWVPMWYVNIRRVTLQVLADSAANPVGTLVPQLPLWNVGDVKLDAAIEKAFVGLGTGLTPYNAVLSSHMEFRFVELKSHKGVVDEALMLSQRSHSGLELFITFNDDFHEQMLHAEDLSNTISDMLFDLECPGRVLCSQNMSNFGSVSQNRVDASSLETRAQKLKVEPLDARQILLSFHRIFCTWERAWLGQPRHF